MLHVKENIIEVLSAEANEQSAHKMKKYMKGHFSFLGLSSTHRRTLTKPLIKELRKTTLDDRLQLSRELWLLDQREYQYVGMDILQTIEKKITIAHIDDIIWLITHKSWWDTVDWLGSHLVGQAFKNHPSSMDSYLLQWLESDDIWLNRVCLIYQLFYKNNTDFERLKDHIYALQPKKEFFIQKAIGWSLRQYSRIDPLAVEYFINDTPLSKVAIREGMRHIRRSS